MARIQGKRSKMVEHLGIMVTSLSTLHTVEYGTPQFGERHGQIHTLTQELKNLDFDDEFLKGADDSNWADDPGRAALARARACIHKILYDHYTGSIAHWFQDKMSRFAASTLDHVLETVEKVKSEPAGAETGATTSQAKALSTAGSGSKESTERPPDGCHKVSALDERMKAVAAEQVRLCIESMPEGLANFSPLKVGASHEKWRAAATLVWRR